MLFALPFPAIDPVMIELGPFPIRWYALAYIAGLLIGWRMVRVMATGGPRPYAVEAIDDFLAWATLGVVLGGRLGYVLFYKAGFYFEHPLAILQVWQGGMSFHGGLLGVIAAAALFARKRKLPFWPLADLLAVVGPLGLFLGRLANFANAELWGRTTDVAWAMVFPTDPARLPRHPSQLYEAALEGLVLFAVMWALSRRPGARTREGFLSGCFLIGYAVARSTAELFREPDSFLGFFLGGLTMGQILCLPMLAVGVWLVRRANAAGREARR